MANKRKCIVDNTEYEYCGRCSDYNSEETWRYIYCSENCRDIYYTFRNYKQGVISANEAMEQFKAYEMPPMEKLDSIMKPVIEKIYSEATPEVESVSNVEETPVAEEAPAVEEEPTVEETPVVETPIRLGRRKRSTVTE